MPLKIKTLTVLFWKDIGDDNDYYTVKKVTDSVEFYPGQVMSQQEVKNLCNLAHWKVTVEQGVRK